MTIVIFLFLFGLRITITCPRAYLFVERPLHGPARLAEPPETVCARKK
jgi:hypothetical protein